MVFCCCQSFLCDQKLSQRVNSFCTPSDRVNFFILKERLDLFRERERERQTVRGRDRHRQRACVFQEGSVEVCCCTICGLVNCARATKSCKADVLSPAPAFVGFLFICFVCCCCYSSAQDLNRQNGAKHMCFHPPPPPPNPRFCWFFVYLFWLLLLLLFCTRSQQGDCCTRVHTLMQ